MRPSLPALAALLSTLALPAAAAPSKDCFDVEDIRNTRVIDARTLEIRVGAAERYRLQLARPQANLGPLDTIGFAPRGGGPICSARDIELIGSAGTAVPVRVPVAAITRVEEPPKP